MNKVLMIAAAVFVALPTMAYAGPCGDKPCTAEQINRALQWLGRPEHEQIGRSRVLSPSETDTPLAPGETRSLTVTRSRSN